MAGNFNNVTLGNGVLTYNGVDVGYLKGDVRYNYTNESLVFETGAPARRRGSVTRRTGASLTAGIAELKTSNLAMALGGLTPTTVAASPVSILDADNAVGTFAAISGTAMQLIVLDGPAVTGLVVENVAEDTTYVEHDDYILDATAGVLYRNPGGDIASGATVRLTYGYTPLNYSQINLGVNFSLSQEPLVFTHTSPVTGKDIVVYMPLAEPSGTVDINFSEENFSVNDVTFNAIFDDDSADYPLGYIRRYE